MGSIRVQQRHNILIDAPTGAVLAVSRVVSSLVFLRECMENTTVIVAADSPKYRNSIFREWVFLFLVLRSKPFAKWSWDNSKREFFETKKELLDDRLVARAILAEEKRKAIEKIMANLNSARNTLMNGLIFQETVYMEKRNQAKAFQDMGYDENRMLEFPYVVQYADFAGITLRQAADDILLQSKFDEDVLAKTDLLRMKYYKRVKEAESINQLPAILEDFTRECYVNARV
jgi:hypothetical protein